MKTIGSGRLLVLACSKLKQRGDTLMPAIDRYDGPAFRVVRRFLREHPRSNLDIYVLSAKFGLIESSNPIPHYDRQMTPHRVRQLKDGVAETLLRAVNDKPHTDLLICAGRAYVQALWHRQDEWAKHVGKIVVLDGSQGWKLSRLYCWLRAGLPCNKTRKPAIHSARIVLRGTTVATTREQVLNAARMALSGGPSQAASRHSWFVGANGRRVPAKRVVSQLTGMPLTSFHTSEALRVLRKLGVEPTHD
jgi:hypothetical protein